MHLDLLPPPPGVRFDEVRHAYTAWSDRFGRWVPCDSVSQVMTASGLKGFDRGAWKRKLVRDGMEPWQAEEFMNHHATERAAIGTNFHALVQHRLAPQGDAPQSHPEALDMLAVWDQRIAPRLGVVRLLEQPMVHRLLLFSGTPDLLAVVDGEPCLLDWKTKASADKARPEAAWLLQLAAYRELVRRNYGIQVDRAVNVMVWHDGLRMVAYNRADLEGAWVRFYEGLLAHHQTRAAEGCPWHQMALQAMAA